MGDLKNYKYSTNQDLYPCEKKFFQTLPPGLKILELGCGTGRVFLHLFRLKPSLLVGIDVNEKAIEILRKRLSQYGLLSANVELRVEDAAMLSVEGPFDLVIFAFNGLDYLYPVEARRKVLKNVEKILSPGGFFYFSSLNPVGIILSPRGILSLPAWTFRLKYIVKGQFLRRYIVHKDGFPLHQALPHAVIREVETITKLSFVRATDRTGLIDKLPLLTLFSSYPYYLFQKK